MKMSPFQRFLNGLESAQLDFNETMNELRAFAEIMARKQNTVELDDEGFFYVTAAGPLEEIIPTLYKQVHKLERIKKQKDEDATR